jgi:hypothetical protein
MRSVGWQGARPGEEIPLDSLIPPRASSGPDYARLIEILMSLRQSLDLESGETILTTDEATRIRDCGLAARAGRWRGPLLPDDLVWFLPVLHALSDAIGPELGRGSRWHPRRAAVLPIIPSLDPLSKFDRRLIRQLQNAPGQSLPRSALKRTYWRRRAWLVDHTIDRLLAADHFTEHDGLFYPFSRAGFKAWREAQARPRRLVPVSMTINFPKK